MEKTLVHEDIYVFIDKVENYLQTKNGKEVTVTNNTKDTYADIGIARVTFTSGDATQVKVACNGRTITIKGSFAVNTYIDIDFRKKLYKYNGQVGLLDNYIELVEGTNNSIVFTSTITMKVEYIYLAPSVNNMDLMFCTSVDVTTNLESLSFKDLRGKTINYKTDTKTHQWSINVIWNDEEEGKFLAPTGLLRIRLIDLDGRSLETLCNCLINSIQKSSSDSGDYTLSISGVCDTII